MPTIPRTMARMAIKVSTDANIRYFGISRRAAALFRSLPARSPFTLLRAPFVRPPFALLRLSGPACRSLIMQKRVEINVLKTSRLVNLFGRIMPESRKAGVFASESDIAYANCAVSSRGMGTTLRAGPFHRQTTGGPGNHPSPSSAAGHWWPHGGRSAAFSI